jgi:hypothetical protein
VTLTLVQPLQLPEFSALNLVTRAAENRVAFANKNHNKLRHQWIALQTPRYQVPASTHHTVADNCWQKVQ